MPNWPFDPEFLQRLEQLRLHARRHFASGYQGERRAYRRGHGSDFFDFRPYAPGDDFRYVDWNMFARFDRLMLKVFEAEENICVHILVDTSASMGIGSPTKLDYALRVAAALVYIGLVNNEHVALGLFDRGPYKIVPPTRGRKRIASMMKLLSGITPTGATDLQSALTAYARQSPRAGLAIVISDLLDSESDVELGIAALIERGFEVRVLQVLAEEEVNPNLEGDLRLIAVEGDGDMNITADDKALARYDWKLKLFRKRIEAYCAGQKVMHQLVTNQVPFDSLLFSILKKGQFLQ